MALSQILSQSQLQKLSPQQIQGIKLLELPVMQLEERIKAEIEENPVLEEDTTQEAEDDEPKESNASLEEYIRNEEAGNSYKLKAGNHSPDDERRTPQLSQAMSLSDYLLDQLAMDDLSPVELTVARFLVGTLDDDGYLRRDLGAVADDVAFKEGLEVDERLVERVLGRIQRLEPSGIGARNLAECLLLQLESLRDQTAPVRLARKILSHYFDEFAKRHFDKIMTRTGASQEELRAAIETITSLNPKPANGYADESVAASPTVVPDFVLDYNETDDVFSFTLPSSRIPNLKINNSYLKLAQAALQSASGEQDKETLQFVKQKIESAKWFITAIKQRQETLTKTMQAILDFQHAYFRAGDAALLRPMILRDIAERTGFDISTISRVVNSKYIDTHFGIFLLKYFFSEGLTTESGEEVSTREIKRILVEAINGEDRQDPMTDEALMELLRDRGFKIARRTVAKYREILEIPVARLRREL